MKVLYRRKTMVNPTYNDVHVAFKLNGFSFNRNDLCRLAYSFIKEGEPYEKSVGTFLLDWFDEKPYMEMITSGTTGKPKTIVVDKQAMVNSAVATGDFFDLHAGNRALHCLPTKYVAGKMMFVRGFILGLDMDFVPPKANPLENNKEHYDFTAMVPLQAENAFSRLSQVKKMIIGGVGMSKTLESRLKTLPTQIYETYGMTETITHIAAKELGEDAFTVLPDVTITYNNKQCLVIHAPRISPEIIQTNDLVELVNENQFRFLGRIDNVVNSGGIKLIPETIEDKISTHFTKRFFVAGVPDEKLGEKLVLIIESEPFEVNQDVFSKLDKYERPKDVLFLPKFEETGTGKIKRTEVMKHLLSN